MEDGAFHLHCRPIFSMFRLSRKQTNTFFSLLCIPFPVSTEHSFLFFLCRDTGIISYIGPADASPSFNDYRVTATNAYGTLSVNLGIRISLSSAQQTLRYTLLYKVYTAGDTVVNDPVQVVPQAVYSVSPSLPAGFTFDTNTGAIRGTANTESPTVSGYLVTAVTPGGNYTATILISVLPRKKITLVVVVVSFCVLKFVMPPFLLPLE
jgi:hypothetical protein